ncbi:MAG: T9SS type A sorting domain-containing protein [Patescibacteria group bacterium]
MKTKVFFLVMLIALACYSLCPISLFAQTYNITSMVNPDPDQNNLSFVWGLDNNNVFAGGENGVFLKYDGSSWSQITIPFQFGFFYSIYGTSPTDVWMTGGNGVLAHYNGSTVENVNIANSNPLGKIFGFSQNDIYVCGFNGTVKHYNGSNWSSIPNSYSNFHFFSMWGTSGSNLYFCGQDSYAPYKSRLVHYDGLVFTELKSLDDGGFTEIWSPDSNIFYIAGNNAVYSYNRINNTIEQVYTGFIQSLYGFDANNIIIAKVYDAYYDSLVVYNGVSWESFPSDCYVNSIFSPTNNPNSVFLVGRGGCISLLDITTGTEVSQPNVSSQLNIYPNPSNGGEINIDLNSNSKATVIVLNSVGQQVQTIFSDGSSGKEPLKINGDLPAGVYFVKVKTDAGDYNQKVIITKN